MDFRPKLIIGLGNPDKTYAGTYHNVGILFIDFLKNYTPYPIPYTLLASDVFMNESGKYVAKMVKKFGVKPEELLIVHDDSDIEIGKYKLTPPGHGSAGHHGVESVQQHLKTNNFWRLRIGIRSAADSRGTERRLTRKKASEFVLKKISPADKATLEKVFEDAREKLD